MYYGAICIHIPVLIQTTSEMTNEKQVSETVSGENWGLEGRQTLVFTVYPLVLL